MDEKFFVPFETALLLKKKGYNGICDYYYTPDKQLHLGVTRVSNDTLDYENNGTVSAPAYHEVLDWLENKDIIIESAKRWVRGNSYAWFSDVHQYNGSIETFIDETREGAINEAIVYALGLM